MPGVTPQAAVHDGAGGIPVPQKSRQLPISHAFKSETEQHQRKTSEVEPAQRGAAGNRGGERHLRRRNGGFDGTLIRWVARQIVCLGFDRCNLGVNVTRDRSQIRCRR